MTLAKPYLKASNTDSANAVAEAVWDMVKPPHLRSPGDITIAYGVVIVSASDTTDVVWHCPPGPINIHLEADATEFQTILGQFVALGYITQAELDQLVANIDAARGGPLDPGDVIPYFWINSGRDLEEITAQGFFTNPDEA